MAVLKIDLFMPCFIDQFRPETGMNMVKVLEKAGCEVNYNIEQTCCGLPAFNAGHWEDAREVGEKLMKEVNTERNLVCGGGACTHMIRNSYDLLFQNSSYHNRYRQLQKKTFELSEFLVDVLKVTSLGSKLNGKAVLMDACQAALNCNIRIQPRELLNQVEGLEWVSLPEPSVCCGFGGMFSVNAPELSVNMANDMLDKVKATGAKYLISTDYSCLMQLESVLLKQGNTSIEVMHIADVLAAGL